MPMSKILKNLSRILHVGRKVSVIAFRQILPKLLLVTNILRSTVIDYLEKQDQKSVVVFALGISYWLK